MTLLSDQTCPMRFSVRPTAASGGHSYPDNYRLRQPQPLQVSQQSAQSFALAMAIRSHDLRSRCPVLWSFALTAEDQSWILASMTYRNAVAFHRVDPVEFAARCLIWVPHVRHFALSRAALHVRRILASHCQPAWRRLSKTRCHVPIHQKSPRATGSCRRQVSGFVVLATMARLFANAPCYVSLILACFRPFSLGVPLWSVVVHRIQPLTILKDWRLMCLLVATTSVAVKMFSMVRAAKLAAPSPFFRDKR